MRPIEGTSSTSVSRKRPLNGSQNWCRRVSSILILCGILVLYAVVSTFSFLAWHPDQPSSSNEIISSHAVFQDHQRRHGSQHASADNDHPDNNSKNISLGSAAFNFSFQDSVVANANAPPFSIFYNVYIPMDQGEEGGKRALDIVQEQMDQVGRSYATAASQKQPVKLYYNTIGMPGVLTEAYMNAVCTPNHIQCIHMQHYMSGFEEYTLQRLYEYCHAQPSSDKITEDHQQHQQHRVVYMHNKGSYHSWSGSNTRWRRHLTAAVTTKECLQPANRTCSVCGLVFFGAWALIFPGNFWAADCAYIRKLPPPPTFFYQMDVVFKRRQEKVAENPLFSIAFPDVENIDNHGAGRYSQEHWVGSHPSLFPCDLTADSLGSWREKDHSPSEFSWSMFPRPEQINDPSTDWNQPPLIAGNLFKWFTLYKQAPADNSWVWRWFPYGEKYRQAVKLYGNRTFDIMVNREIERFRTLFAPSGNTTTDVL
jgi:hypothetical protein